MKGDILPVEIMARREDWSYGISLYMRQETVGLGMSIARPVEFVSYDMNMTAEPMIRLSIEQGQQLIDELWQCGLRPSEGTGSAGSLAATERHLADMRKLVFKDKVTK